MIGFETLDVTPEEGQQTGFQPIDVPGQIPYTSPYHIGFLKRLRRGVYTMEKELLFITVIGEDRKGIVAKISMLLYECDINIEDINQKIMDSYFVMIMLVDMKESKQSLEKVREGLEKIGEELGLQIQIQHENIFKMMHRV